MSKSINSKIESLKDRLGVKKIPKSKPVPVEWMIDLYLGNLAPVERKELKANIEQHMKENADHVAPDQAFMDKHRAEVDMMIEELISLRAYEPTENISENR